MHKITLLLLHAIIPACLFAQADSVNILGLCTINDLNKEPYSEWFSETYSSYIPNQRIMEEIKGEDMKNVEISIYFGTWCGDSRREVPRFLKILDGISQVSMPVQLIGIGDGKTDSLYRQAPNHEEVGKHVYRVPTIIVSVNDKEIGRIVEYPSVSLERDLLDILRNSYIPNYPAYLLLSSWLDEGIFDDVNVSCKGLANQIRPFIVSVNELNSFANILLRREKVNVCAITTILRINNNLYPDIYWTYTKLAESLSNNEGKHQEATEIIQDGLEHIKDESDLKRMQDLLETILNKED